MTTTGRIRIVLSLIVALTLTSVWMIGVPGTQAAASVTITVTTVDDELTTDGDCSLREALVAANTNTAVDACAAGSGAAVDTVNVPAGTYTLSRAGADEDAAQTGDLDATDAAGVKLVGQGADATIIDGGAIDRVVDIHSGDATIEGVTVRNGQTPAGADGGGIRYATSGGTLMIVAGVVRGNSSARDGGGIENDGQGATVRIISSTIADNYASNSGGGIANYSHNATVIVEDSSVVDNEAENSTGGGAGIYGRNTDVEIRGSSITNNVAASGGGFDYWPASYDAGDGGTVTIENTTIGNNRTTGFDGGGIQNSGDATITLWNVTVANNSATRNGGGIKRGAPATYTLANTIVADNTAVAGSQCYSDAGGVNSSGYNLVSAVDGCNWSPASGDVTGTDAAPVDPLLGPASGAPASYPLLLGSPALDAGYPAPVGGAFPACTATDQRGVARPQGDRCDIGAYERGENGLYLSITVVE